MTVEGNIVRETVEFTPAQEIPSQVSEGITRRQTPPAVFLVSSAVTLLSAKKDIETHRGTYAEVKALSPEEPLNRESNITTGIMNLVREQGIKHPDKTSLRPYWNQNLEYNPMEVFGALIQYLDYHTSTPPQSILPPEKDVQAFIDRIMQKQGPVTVVDQLAELLTITKGNIMGAINLGFIASRFIGRGLDTKAYPGIVVDDEKMLEWGKKISQFDVKDGDSTGDTYYFWTHAFAGLFFSIYEKRTKALYQRTFRNGTSIMVFVRKWITRLPTTSDHRIPSNIGREIGLALAKESFYSESE